MKYLATEGDLRKVILPQQTSTYKPISHAQLIDLTLESVYQAGFVVDKVEYTSARDGNIANGRYTIKNVSDSEMQLMIGFQNSIDKSLSLKWAVGTRLFICENGCVSSDYGNFKRKHTGDVQNFTPDAIFSYVKSAGEAFRRIQMERDAMKNIEVTKRVCAELIGRMLIEEEFLSSSQVSIIREQMLHPSFNYGSENSLWQLYQHTTYALKEDHPFNWMNSHLSAHKFFVDNSNIVVPVKEIEIVDKSQLELALTC